MLIKKCPKHPVEFMRLLQHREVPGLLDDSEDAVGNFIVEHA
jgi:hypothetical protein